MVCGRSWAEAKCVSVYVSVKTVIYFVALLKFTICHSYIGCGHVLYIVYFVTVVRK